MNGLPQDPMMLMSVINMKLRDFYTDLDTLCEDLSIDRKELEEKLGRPILPVPNDGYAFVEALIGETLL